MAFPGRAQDPDRPYPVGGNAVWNSMGKKSFLAWPMIIRFAVVMGLLGLLSLAMEHWGERYMSRVTEFVADQGSLAPMVFIAVNALLTMLLVPQVLFHRGRRGALRLEIRGGLRLGGYDHRRDHGLPAGPLRSTRTAARSVRRSSSVPAYALLEPRPSPAPHLPEPDHSCPAFSGDQLSARHHRSPLLCLTRCSPGWPCFPRPSSWPRAGICFPRACAGMSRWARPWLWA